MTRALIVVTYLMASATVGTAMFMVSGIPVGLLTGGVLALACSQMHAAWRRGREKHITDREITGLKRVSFQFEQALNDTRSRMDDMSKAIEAKHSAQNRKIVAELQVLESLMRDFASKVSRNAVQQPAADRPAPPRQGTVASYANTLGTDSGMLEIIRSSLEQNRVDLYLQPIVSLPQRKLRYYEALSRLRSEDGKVIMPEQYIKVAAPAGLMSVVDNLLLFRCVQIVRRLTPKNRDIGVFCNISGDTLTDTEFFPQFLEYMHHNRDLAGHIVFEFAQDAVAQAGAQGESNLAYLSSLGFALSMDHVSSLAIDFIKMKKMGFRHFKVRAHTLTNGMSGANAAVSAEDFKKLLERNGLNLIAERVEDEKTVVQILDYGVDYAQGYLFGEPRAVREETLKAVDATPSQNQTVVPLRKIA
ncbi:MAG: EAL domain-containing protein [Alphaproteobacteria bacterium]|nr:EAL domain-containing protein [Alphaproteobacteria bacterium]MBL7099159.1 EAL domain-containing protein [Alphaproteobacteria bacterium]